MWLFVCALFDNGVGCCVGRSFVLRVLTNQHVIPARWDAREEDKSVNGCRGVGVVMLKLVVFGRAVCCGETGGRSQTRIRILGSLLCVQITRDVAVGCNV